MATDYGEKERAFIDGLKENTGRDLAEWMAAITGQDLAHRNDIIDWLRQHGFTFSKASWLERIHHNAGKPIYADAVFGKPRPRRLARDRGAQSPAPTATAPPPIPAPAPAPIAAAPATHSAELDSLLAKAKAYRPLALALIAQIKAVRPTLASSRAQPSLPSPTRTNSRPWASGAKSCACIWRSESTPFDEVVKKGAAGGGLGKTDALTHMVVLTDARQIDRRLMDLVARAAANVNG